MLHLRIDMNILVCAIDAVILNVYTNTHLCILDCIVGHELAISVSIRYAILLLCISVT